MFSFNNLHYHIIFEKKVNTKGHNIFFYYFKGVFYMENQNLNILDEINKQQWEWMPLLMFQKKYKMMNLNRF